jgi:glycosyltransferase involved in cell wall biosynthesis
MRILKIDLVNTHGAGIFCITTWMAAKLLKIPVVHTIQHTYAIKSMTENLTVKIPGLRHFLYSLVNTHIALCNYTKNEFINLWRIPPRKIYLNPVGVELREFKPFMETETKIKLKQELSIELDAPIIGIVARLSPVKGVHKAIHILPRIKEEIPNVKLVIIGDGSMRKEYEKLADNLHLRQNIIFTGFRSDIPQLMNIFDIYLQTTDSPLIGNTTLEAMATGKPIATIVQNKTEEAMARETLIEGYNGILIPLNHSEAATKLGRLLKDKQTLDKMGKASRKLAEEKFNLQLHVKNMERLYRDLICSSKK